MAHPNRVAVKRSRAGIENDAGVEGRHYSLTASAHLLIPDFETSAVFLVPILVQIDKHVNSPLETDSRVEIKISMYIEMPSVVHLVEAGTGKIWVGDQAFDTGQVFNETYEWHRVERIEQRPEGR